MSDKVVKEEVKKDFATLEILVDDQKKAFVKRAIYFSNSGSPIEFKYKYKINTNGRKELARSGEITKVYDLIQSHKDECNIYKIVEKFANGDISVLDKNKGVFCDISSIPTNYSDFANKLLSVKDEFGSMPIDFKSLFGNDVGVFVEVLKNGDINSYIDKYNDFVINKYGSPLVPKDDQEKKEVAKEVAKEKKEVKE